MSRFSNNKLYIEIQPMLDYRDKEIRSRKLALYSLVRFNIYDHIQQKNEKVNKTSQNMIDSTSHKKFKIESIETFLHSSNPAHQK